MINDPYDQFLFDLGLIQQEQIGKIHDPSKLRMKYRQMKKHKQADLQVYQPVLYTYDPHREKFWNTEKQEFYKSFPVSPVPIQSDDQIINDKIKQLTTNLPCAKVHHHQPTELKLDVNSLTNLPLYQPKKVKEEKEQIRCKTTRIFIPSMVRKIFQSWFALHRKIYNKTLEILAVQPTLSKYDTRDLIITHFTSEIDAVIYPRTSAEGSIFEAHKNMKLARKTPNAKCEPKAYNSLTQTIEVDGRCIKDGVIYPRSLKKLLANVVTGLGKSANAIKKDQKTKINKILSKCKIGIPTNKQIAKLMFDKQSGYYYLVVPEVREQVEKPHLSEIVSIDPGVSPFMNFYSTEYHGSIGGNTIKTKVNRKLKRGDKLLAKAKQEKNFYKRSKLLRLAAKCRREGRYIVDDLQNKSANFFAKNYRYIFLPELRTKDMVMKGDLHSSINRAIMTSSQYRFRERIILKCKEFKSTVILCEEYFTTQTCTGCGNCYKLGGEKVYKCKACGLVIDRDYNSARNIMIKNLSLVGKG